MNVIKESNINLNNIKIQNPEISKNRYYFTGKTEQADGLVKKDASNDGKFTFKEAMKNFGKGILSPVKAIIKHPIAALGMIAGVGVLCAAAPALAPVIGIGFAAASIIELASGSAKAVKNYKNGQYDEAEKSFEKIGSGTINTVLSILGLKTTAKTAAEAKYLHGLNKDLNYKVNVLSQSQKNHAYSMNNNKNGFINDLKENLSMITTKEGRGAVIEQLNPSGMKERLSNAFARFFKIPEKNVKFEETTEGIRRANLTTEQIESEIQTKFNQIFDELEVPEGKRPKLKFEKTDNDCHGGSYNAGTNSIIIYNAETHYKNDILYTFTSLMHEARHCKEAILRRSLPQERIDAVVKDELLNRIINGDSERVYIGPDADGNNITTKLPKMTPAMRKDFAKIAEEVLYNRDITNNFFQYLRNKECSMNPKYRAGQKAVFEQYAAECAQQPELHLIITKLKDFMNKYPEFQEQYNSKQIALDYLIEYAFSHNARYTGHTQKAPNVPEIKETLSPEMLKQAEQSLRGFISTWDGNTALFEAQRNNIELYPKIDRQYRYSTEEAMVEKNARIYVLNNLKKELARLKETGKLTSADKKYLMKRIRETDAHISQYTKGQKYQPKYTELLSHPENAELAKEVARLEQELRRIELDTAVKLLDISNLDKSLSFAYPNISYPLGKFNDNKGN